MSIPEQYRDRFRSIAQHEMGHYVASRRLGFRTGDVSVMLAGIGMGHSGGATIMPYEPLRTIEDVLSYLERRTIVLYAGALSETLFSPEPTRRLTEDNQRKAVEIIKDPQSGAHIDHAKIRELRIMIRNLKFPDTDAADDSTLHAELDGIDKELWREAIDLVNQHFDLICGLAGNLTQRLSTLKERVTISAIELEALKPVQELEVRARKYIGG